MFRIKLKICNIQYIDTRYILRNRTDSKTWKDILSKHQPKEIWCSFINLKQKVRQNIS